MSIQSQIVSAIRAIDVISVFSISTCFLQPVSFSTPSSVNLASKLVCIVSTGIRKRSKILKSMILTFHFSGNYLQMVISVGSGNFVSKVDDFEKVARVVSKLKAKKEITKSHSYALSNE